MENNLAGNSMAPRKAGNTFIKYAPASGLIGYIIKNYNHPIIITDPRNREAWIETSEELFLNPHIESCYSNRLSSESGLVVIDDYLVVKNLIEIGFNGSIVFCKFDRDSDIDFHFEEFENHFYLKAVNRTPQGWQYVIEPILFVEST